MDRSWALDRDGWTEAPRSSSSAAAPDWMAAEPSLCSRLEPLLGADCSPDPVFFVESWTLGASTAVENLRRRQPLHQPTHAPAGFSALNAIPRFWASADWLRCATVPVPQSFPQAVRPDDDVVFDDRFFGEKDGLPTRPLTVDRARRLLGVAANSTRDQMKAAYRQLASRFHPDRYMGQDDKQRRLANQRMAAVNEAYRLLCAAEMDSAV